MFHNHTFSIHFLIATTILVVGCGRGAPAPPGPAAKPAALPAVSVSRTGWGWEQHDQPSLLPGIDYASIVYYSWDDDIALAIWTDGHKDPSGMSKTRQQLWGKFEFENGRTVVEYDCSTSDGKTGTLTLHDQSLDLSKGWLILVSTSDGYTRIKQISQSAFRRKKGANAAPLQIQINEHFANMKDDSSIVEFFRDSKKQD